MKLSELDLNLLHVLHTVLDEGAVGRAAARLNVTPPAVSNALGRLRDLLDDPLLVRRGRGLVPTPRAQELAPHLARTFAELKRALHEGGDFDPEASERRFVLACSDADQLCEVPRLAAALRAAMPRAQLHVTSLDQLTATDGLGSGAVDVAFAPTGALDEVRGLHSRPLVTDEAVLVVRRDHPVAAGELTREGFNALGHVDLWLGLWRPGTGHQMAEAFLRDHGLERDVAVIVPSFTAAAMVAAETDLAAGMPLRVARKFAQTLPLAVLRIPAPPMRLQLELVWHERTDADAGAQAFRDLIVETVSGPQASR